MINKVFNRKQLARVSAVPGKTATINFFRLESVRFADLPGYGYAKRSKTEKARLEQMISGYILQRKQLACVFVLVDVRHEPQQIDLDFINWLGASGIPFAIVFTKADKLSAGKVAGNVEAYKAKLTETWEELPPIFITSSETRVGKEELLGYIDSVNKSLKDA